MPSTAKQTTPARKRSFRLTEQEKGMIVTLFLDGYRPSEIATNMTRAYMTVATVITDAGYSPERYSYTEQEAALWEDMYLGTGKYSRHCVREIAELAEVPMSRVDTALLRRGVRKRHPALAIRISAEKRRKSRQ